MMPSDTAKDTHADMSDATLLLTAAGKGDPQAAEELLELVYRELHQLATHKMTQEPPGQTLQPTALVHEAWLRLMSGKNPQFENRAHFFAAAAEAMRRILIDRARRKLTVRHGGGYRPVSLEELDWGAPDIDQELLAVDELMDSLTKKHPAQAEVVKLRFFAGLANDEIADVLGISVSTVKNYWTFARAWLFREITDG